MAVIQMGRMTIPGKVAPDGWHCVSVLTHGLLRAGNMEHKVPYDLHHAHVIGYCILLDRSVGELCMDALNEWCRQHCRGRITVNPARQIAAADYHFEFKQDAALFKLTWC